MDFLPSAFGYHVDGFFIVSDTTAHRHLSKNIYAEFSPAPIQLDFWGHDRWKGQEAMVFNMEGTEDIYLWVEILSSSLATYTFQSYA